MTLAIYLGGSPTLALGGGLLLLAGCLSGAVWDVIALERILREGLPALALVALLGLVLVRWSRSAAALGISANTLGAPLLMLVLGGLAVRLVIVLHPVQVGGRQLRFVVAWAGTYLLLNLASGGLTGPDLVRYLTERFVLER